MIMSLLINKAVIILVFVLLMAIPANADNISWYRYEDGMTAAKDLDKPVFLDFYANWCSPCVAMEENTYPDAQVISEMKDFIAIKVDTQVRVDIESKYHVAYYPTVVFLDSKGNEISRHIGYLGPEDMIKTINESRGKLPREAPGFEGMYLLFVPVIFALKKIISGIS